MIGLFCEITNSLEAFYLFERFVQCVWRNRIKLLLLCRISNSNKVVMTKFLIIRFSSIGDIIQCMGIIGGIRERFADVEICRLYTSIFSNDTRRMCVMAAA